MNKAAVKAKITAALRKGIRGRKSELSELVPKAFTAGKVYEAYILGILCQRLTSREGFSCVLVGSTKVALKSSPGPINTAFPHIRVYKNGGHVADIWTDIEFTSLSAFHQGKVVLSQGEYHEIDIALVAANSQARPLPSEVLLAVECKNTGYQKSLLREILGVRRELSLLVPPIPTFFTVWPRSRVPADPPSCVAVFSSDASVLAYQAPGSYFGIDFNHEPL